MPLLDDQTLFLSYIEAALWSSTDESDESGGRPLDDNYDLDDIDLETRAEMQRDCDSFLNHPVVRDALAKAERIHSEGGMDLANASSVLDLAGYHFWMSRVGHGTGFWNGMWPDDLGDDLHGIAETYGDYNLYVGDDGKIHGQQG